MIEMLVAGAVVKVATRLGDKWLGAVADRLDEEVRGILHGLLDPNAPADTEALEEATEQVGQYLQNNPGGTSEIVNATLAAAPVPQVDRMAAFLDILIAVAAGARRPVALAGFFNSETCVLVIDARTRDGEPNPVMLENQSFGQDPEDRSIFFENDADDVLSIARFWLINARTELRRNEIVTMLEERFDTGGPGQSLTTFHLTGPNYGLTLAEGPERLKRVDRAIVTVDERDAGPDSSWYLIRTAEGTRTLRDSVVKLAEGLRRKYFDMSEALDLGKADPARKA